MVKFIETESRMVSRGWGGRRNGKLVFMETEFQSEKIENFQAWMVVIVAHH